MSLARVKSLKELICDGSPEPSQGWALKAVVNDDNMTYFVSNEKTREAIVVDPVREDWDVLQAQVRELTGYRWLAVIDTHTHADHFSCAGELAQSLRVPLVMHQLAPSKKIDLRVSRDTALSSAASPLRLLVTPGHTQDSLTVIWGPFLFGADTLLYGDTGRDDLPTGDPAAHYESLQKIKAAAQDDMLFLPGHDGEGGRITSWKTQLKVNPGLTQSRDVFVKEAGAYVGPAPKLLKESLFENFK
jgi:glyoxylase-like metal-dependent hydrolase (beta-lactamase superfamily II)